MIQLHVTSTPIQAALDELSRRCGNLQPAFNAIGEEIKNNVALCFHDEKSPDGIPWHVLSPSTIKKRGSSANILQDTGAMFGSLHHVATNSYADISVNKKYAAMMNFGGTKAQFPHLWGDIPARPFMPKAILPHQWEQDVMTVLNRFLMV